MLGTGDGTIAVKVTLDGAEWQAPVRTVLCVEIDGTWYRTGLGGDHLPEEFTGLPRGLTYCVGYIYRGKIGGLFMGVKPKEAELAPDDTLTFNMNFTTSGCGGG